MQKRVNDSGRHTACDEQHDFTMHIEVLNAQLCVILSHGSSNEHEMPGAQ